LIGGGALIGGEGPAPFKERGAVPSDPRGERLARDFTPPSSGGWNPAGVVRISIEGKAGRLERRLLEFIRRETRKGRPKPSAQSFPGLR